jgi:hypothetical protein
MQVPLKRCAGLDVHEMVAAYARPMVRGSCWARDRAVGTTTSELMRLAEWSHAQGCRHALEATGVYLKPVWNIKDSK